MLGDTGEFSVFLDDAFDRARGEAAEIAGSVDGIEVFAVVEKKGNERISAGIEIIPDPVGGGFGDEDRAVFAAFAANDEFATVKVDGIAIELDELRDAEPAGEK